MGLSKKQCGKGVGATEQATTQKRVEGEGASNNAGVGGLDWASNNAGGDGWDGASNNTRGPVRKCTQQHGRGEQAKKR